MLYSLHFLSILTGTPAYTSLRSKLASFPPDAHWFCPAHGEEDPALYNNPDEPDHGLTVSQKHRRIQEASVRLKNAYRNSLICGTGPEDFEEAEEWQESFRQGLNHQLTRCFECIREYHKGRRGYLEQLASFVPNSDGRISDANR